MITTANKRVLKNGLTILFMLQLLLVLLTGCGGIKTIKPEYKSGYEATRLFHGEDPLVTINEFYDDRATSDKIGDGYNAYGNKLEIWVSENNPLMVIQDAIVEQLKCCGFNVVRTTGWNFEPNSIPEQVKTRLLIGGKLKTCWVESRPNFWTVSINSKVAFDLIIVDTKENTNLFTGQFTGGAQSSHGYRGADDMQNSISFALTQAVNKAFQDETVRKVFQTKWQ